MKRINLAYAIESLTSADTAPSSSWSRTELSSDGDLDPEKRQHQEKLILISTWVLSHGPGWRTSQSEEGNRATCHRCVRGGLQGMDKSVGKTAWIFML